MKLVTLVVIIGLYLVVRLWKLTEIPFFVNGDEAHIGLEARKLLSGEVTDMATPGWYSYPQLTFLLAAVPMAMFGNNLFGLRMASVLLGLLSTVCIYKITRIIGNRKLAVIASLFLVLSHYHIHFSRSGTQYMQGLTAQVAGIYFLMKGFKHRQWGWFSLLGLSMGLGLQLYLSARLIFPLTVLFVLWWHRWGQEGKRITLVTGATWVMAGLLGFIAGILPVSTLWRNNPDSLISRTREVFIFSQPHVLFNEYNTDDWKDIITGQVKKTTMFFVNGGDRSSQYGYRGPAIDPLTALLFLTGSVVVTLEWFKRKDFSSSMWMCMVLWTMTVLVVGGVLTTDNPFSPRLLPAMGPVSILAAVGVGTISDRLKKKQWVANGAMVSALIAVALLNAKMYFVDFQRQDVDYNSYRYTYLAKKLGSIVAQDPLVRLTLISDPGFFLLDHGTIHFLSPNVRGVTKNHWEGERGSNNDDIDQVLIFSSDRLQDLKKFQTVEEEAKTELLLGRKGEVLFYLATRQ